MTEFTSVSQTILRLLRFSRRLWVRVALMALLAVAFVMLGMFGGGAAFSPLIANVTRWFDRRRGLAVAIVASGAKGSAAKMSAANSATTLGTPPANAGK